MAYARTTELEAINVCLGVIGEQPVNSVLPGVSKASIAQGLLHEFSREIQEAGINSNTEVMDLSPDSNGFILLPSTALNVDPVYNPDNHLIERAGKLYDRTNNTFVINRTVTVEIVTFLPWTDLPEAVRRYITIRTARVFQARFLSDTSLHRFTEDDEQDAKGKFERLELSNGDFTIFDNMNINPRVYTGGR